MDKKRAERAKVGTNLAGPHGPYIGDLKLRFAANFFFCLTLLKNLPIRGEGGLLDLCGKRQCLCMEVVEMIGVRSSVLPCGFRAA